MKFLIFISLFILFSCVDEEKEMFVDEVFNLEQQNNLEQNNETLFFIDNNDNLSYTSTIIGGISYSFSSISGVDYLERKGEIISESDLNSIEDETVIMLEFTEENTIKNIFENQNLQYNKDDAIKYLVGDIINDFVITQFEKSILPHSHIYEGQLGANNKIRVTFYIKGLDQDSSYKIEFYDRFFGKGIIKLNSINTTIS